MTFQFIVADTWTVDKWCFQWPVGTGPTLLLSFRFGQNSAWGLDLHTPNSLSRHRSSPSGESLTKASRLGNAHVRVLPGLDTRLFRVLNRPEAGTALAGGVSHQIESRFTTKGRRPTQFLFADPGVGHGGANTIALPHHIQCQRS